MTTHLARNYMEKHRARNEKYRIRIISDTPVNEQEVKDRFREYYTQQSDNLSYALKRLTFKEISLGAFGIILIAIWFYLSMKSESINGKSFPSWVGFLCGKRPTLPSCSGRGFGTCRNRINRRLTLSSFLK